MATAEQILAIARSQIGTREAANGSNPYGRAYGVDRVAWCAQFAWWVFKQAGADALIMQKTAYTPTLYDWYRQRGRTSTTPQVGSLVFFNWPDSVNRIQHVGIVESVEPAAVVTIEGNTSQGTAGSQSDGGGVWRRRRARNSSIVGYAHPAYTAAPASSKDWFDMASLDDLRRVLREEILMAGVPDYYTADTADRMWLSECVAWGTTHAADARDAARESAAKVTTLESKVDALLARVATSGGAAPITQDPSTAVLSDDQLARIARAVTDEQDRRARARLDAA